VHPDYHGRGYGRKLVEQGLEVSRNDGTGNLPACVIAADGKEVFYQKCGFGNLVGWVSRTFDDKGRDNPLRLNGVSGGAVLWTA
jgi:GNAT superfamily N-acetyltransferase